MWESGSWHACCGMQRWSWQCNHVWAAKTAERRSSGMHDERQAWHEGSQLSFPHVCLQAVP